jgi:hypothetical protein
MSNHLSKPVREKPPNASSALRLLTAASGTEYVSTIIPAYRLAYPKDELAGQQKLDMIQNTSCVPPRVIRSRRIVRLCYVRANTEASADPVSLLQRLISREVLR